MTPDSFLYDHIRPTLDSMGMWSIEAEKILFMTAAHESGGFKYNKQINGPALSYFQIEPATLYDIWERYFYQRPDRKRLVEMFMNTGEGPLDSLANNINFSCAIARIKYAMIPESIPLDNIDMAIYCKKYWNTGSGKATPEKYLNDFLANLPQSIPEGW